MNVTPGQFSVISASGPTVSRARCASLPILDVIYTEVEAAYAGALLPADSPAADSGSPGGLTTGFQGVNPYTRSQSDVRPASKGTYIDVRA